MSRVEEARRRAAGDVQPRPYPDLSSVIDVPGNASVLDDYPREHRAADRTSPVAASRTIAAPRSVSSGHMASLEPGLKGKLVGGSETQPIVLEQYRRLASSLHHLQVDAGLKTLMVTSALPRDGKTLTVTNLALTLSGSYLRRVLLIDADLRRPSLHTVFRLPKTTGLSEALRSGNRPHFLELSPLLSILPAGEGTQDPLGALTSDRFATLLTDCATAFDWVLLDSPPVGLMPDGNVLAKLTKAVVFVIGAGTTSHKIIERAIAEIGRDNIVGTVLNRIDEKELSTAEGYDHYYSMTDSPR